MAGSRRKSSRITGKPAKQLHEESGSDEDEEMQSPMEESERDGSEPEESFQIAISEPDRPQTKPTAGSSKRTSANMQEQTKRVEQAIHDRDAKVLAFLEKLHPSDGKSPGYTPIVPEPVLDHYFMKAGFDCPDPRVRKFIALMAHKFMSDVTRDAYQYSRLRMQGMTAKDKKSAGNKVYISRLFIFDFH